MRQRATPGIVGVLLTAGHSRRFGSDKLLHVLPDGRVMALAALEALTASCDEVVAVLRPAQQALMEILVRRNIRVIVSAEATLGMGHSIAAAVAASANARGWIVGLGDMPHVRAETAARVVAALRDGASIAVPAHGGRRGHPVGFSSEWRDHLLQLHGDVGARAILTRFAEKVSEVGVDDPGVLLDIDLATDQVASDEDPSNSRGP